jgi:hypothetical protein
MGGSEHIVQGGSDISGTLSKLTVALKKLFFKINPVASNRLSCLPKHK